MKQSAPLSSAQYGIYVECVGHTGEALYNLPYIYILDRKLDEERLRHAIESFILSHPTFFTRISIDDNGEPVQTVDSEEWNLVVEDAGEMQSSLSTLTGLQCLVEPFDIIGGRLFNVRLFRGTDHYYFFADFLHIIADGFSQKVMLREIDSFYRGEVVDAEQVSLAEMAVEEQEERKSPAFEEAKQWYATNFDCSDTYTQLMPDLEEPEHKEAHFLRTLGVSMDRVDAFCRDNGVFRSTFFTAAYSYLLARYNNESESLFTTIYNGRDDKRLGRTIGMFIKTLPVYAKFDAETTVLDFLRAIQEQMRGCREHSIYSFADIMRDLQVQSNSMFAWHGNLFSDSLLGGLPLEIVRIGNSTLSASFYLKAFIRSGHYQVKAEYNANEYSQPLVAAFIESYEAVIEGMLSATLLRDIDITTPQQVEKLDGFNRNDADYDDTQTIVSLFRRQAQATPDNIAVIFAEKTYTYAQVDDMSDRIAATIAAKGLGEGDVVSVLIPRGKWMVTASLGVLKAGCAYQPLDPSYPTERLNFMVQDAGARLLIADASLRPLVDEYQGEVMLTSELEQCAPGPLPAGPTPDSLFVLLYTSGSTGIPKGCQLLHSNLVAFCNWYQKFYNLQYDSRVAAYASYGFDACMMDMYPALISGAAVCIVPEELRLDLIALNDYFERFGVTHSFMTTQVGYQFVSNIDNHSLLHLSVGGEKMFSIAPPKNLHFYNCYGPTECTIFTTIYPFKNKLKEVPIGKPLDNLRLYVVDQQGRRLPVGAAGELWVSGPQVSKGYLNRPEKTAESFIANPFTDNAKYARVYRTGDIVRYLPSGDIQFVGRRDGQVKIRGFRIELKEVESIIREFPGIHDATVQAFDEEGGGKFIAAYVVSDAPVDIEAMNNFILEKKPPYMVPAVTMQIDAIPLNQNQKVNKRALPRPERKAAEVENVNVPMNVLEEELHDLVAGIVGNADFGVTTVLGFAGLTSISAIRLAVLVNKRFGVALDSKTLVKSGTIQSIENDILRKLMAGEPAFSDGAAPKAEKRVFAPLSYAQTGVYFDCLKQPTSTIYNIPSLFTYPVGTDPQRLADAVKRVAECHPELRVHFTTEGENIVQTLEGAVEVQVPVSQMTDEQLAAYKHDFVRPFNLQKAPLYRFEVVTTPTTVHLLIDVHHLVFDGGSADLFIQQVHAAYEGGDVTPERYNYLDFVADQQAAESTEEFRASQQFFADMLQTCEGASEIPADLPKTDRQGWMGEAVCKIDFDAATAFCRQQNITPAHLFLAATAYVVSRYTNNREVYLCTVSSGRSNLNFADTVGMFVNTLALGLNVADVSVADFLHTIGDTFDQTLRHEDYPFARIATDFAFRPAIAYAYQVGVLSSYQLGGQPVGQELLELNVPKFKINIKVESRGVVVQYDDAVYSSSLATALAESIVAVAVNMIGQPSAPVRKLSIIGSAQEEQLKPLRQTATGDAPFRLFHDCITHFATTQPDHQALVAIDAAYTYQEMDAVTNRIANALRQKGVRERDCVALLLPRTSRLILALFGVLKAGAAYIPCDPKYPADRIRFILDDSEARFVITTADRLDSVCAERAIDVEQLIAEGNDAPVATDVTPDDLAYLIYTSGSTGRPKGVMLRHEGICNYLYGHPANVFAHAVSTDAKRVLSVTTISFDAALQDIGMALFNGKTLVVATEEQANNPLDLSRLIAEQHINMVSGTPSRWQTWLTSDDFCRAISQVAICRAGGEKFSDQLLYRMRKATKARIFNCYGPTEITVASNNKELTTADIVTVGKPQLNVREFIVDTDGNELPVGVVGELYIGGRGVAKGYNNLDEMTRERFIDYHGERIYKSGDYAKWLPDGDVVILGRTDHQIKLRGLRIELGEIENVMLRVEGMEKVVILIRQLNGKEHLCAYYTANREIAPDQLKAEISKSLTQYMVPTAYLQLAEMPMTPNGKTDVKALPEPQLAVSSAYTAPTNETERTFCEIFAGILQMDKVGATDNFFELGGTSLVVTRVVIEAEKVGLHVAYGDVFANPTPRQLACLVSGGSADGEMDEISDYDYTAIENLLQRNTLGNFRKGERHPLGRVLLTGATGYLGIHILRELIDSDAPQIYCLVRGKTQEAAESRLRTLLYYYFSNAFKPLFGNRLHVILGDVTADFGEGLEVDTVFNCAAIVKHFSEDTEIEDVNIGGARRCIEFCERTGARLVHVSTASVRGMWAGEKRDDVFTERRFFMGQYLGNKYILSKFMAERFILEAVSLHGLKAKIMRVGNLAARSTDGEFQANFSTNSFMGRIRVYNMLGCCPYGMRNKRVEFSPVNEVSKAIVLLATTPDECTVFHPYNIHTQFLGDVLTGLSAVGEGIRFVEQEEFAETMEAAQNDPRKASQMSSLLAYQDMAHGQKTSDVSRDNDYTTQVLYRLGFSWSPTSWDYVERMLTTIDGFGFFE